jgi:hypothetical protein
LAGIACAIAAVDGAITHNFAAYLVLGFGGGSLIGFLVLAALFSLYVRVAERHSPWLARRRANDPRREDREFLWNLRRRIYHREAALKRLDAFMKRAGLTIKAKPIAQPDSGSRRAA